MTQIRFFWPQRELCYSARTGLYNWVLVSAKSGKLSLLRLTLVPPVQVMGMENTGTFSDKFSKLYLLECHVKQPLMKNIFVGGVQRYFSCSPLMQLIGWNTVLACSDSLNWANKNFSKNPSGLGGHFSSRTSYCLMKWIHEVNIRTEEGQERGLFVTEPAESLRVKFWAALSCEYFTLCCFALLV